MPMLDLPPHSKENLEIATRYAQAGDWGTFCDYVNALFRDEPELEVEDLGIELPSSIRVSVNRRGRIMLLYFPCYREDASSLYRYHRTYWERGSVDSDEYFPELHNYSFHTGPSNAKYVTKTKKGKKYTESSLWVGTTSSFPLFGVENELCLIAPLTSKSVRATVSSLSNAIITKSDSSIGASGTGAEFMSVPGTHIAMRDQVWDAFFRNAGKYWRGWNRKTCGMHIHVSRNIFTFLQIGKLFEFFRNNPTFIIDVAGRENNGYCNSIPRNTKSYKVAHPLKNTSYSDRGAINLGSGKGTIEFRMFAATVNYWGFKKNIDFLAALVAWLGQVSAKSVTVPEFLKFIEENRDTYRWFYNWAIAHDYITPSTKLRSLKYLEWLGTDRNPKFFLSSPIEWTDEVYG